MTVHRRLRDCIMDGGLNERYFVDREMQKAFRKANEVRPPLYRVDSIRGYKEGVVKIIANYMFGLTEERSLTGRLDDREATPKEIKAGEKYLAKKQ